MKIVGNFGFQLDKQKVNQDEKIFKVGSTLFDGMP